VHRLVPILDNGVKGLMDPGSVVVTVEYKPL